MNLCLVRGRLLKKYTSREGDLVNEPLPCLWTVIKKYTSREGDLVNEPLPSSWTVFEK